MSAAISYVSLFFDKYNDPAVFAALGWIFVASYYVTSWGFIAHEKAKKGIWKKNGFFDRATTFIWFGFTVALIISSIDLIVKNEMSLTMLAIYYVLFLFLFAFIYNLIAWHSPGSVEKLGLGWTTEIQCLILSVSMMTGSGHTTVQPKNAVSDSIASVQSLIGLAFVAVFIAKAVSVVSAAPKCG
jgi:hypothetical protein